MTPLVAPVIQRLKQVRVNLSNEKATQAEIATALAGAGMQVEREVRLAPRDVIDLLVDGGIAVEVKLRSTGKVAVYRQIARYARHDRVQAIVLATNLSMGLPREIEGKPAYYVALGQAWL